MSPQHLFAQSREASICSLDSPVYLSSFLGVTLGIQDTQMKTSEVLSPNATLCRTSRIVLPFLATVMCFVFDSLIFIPTLFASLSKAR
jgi:hypothetical protein